MSLDTAPQTDGRWELSRTNLKRLEGLMGEKYDSMEMEDYLSYVPPEDASTEIDGLEARLKKGRQQPSQIMEEFKAHLSYVYAAR